MEAACVIGGGANGASVSLFSPHTSVSVCVCGDICSRTLCTSVFVSVNIDPRGRLVRMYRADLICLMRAQYGAVKRCRQRCKWALCLHDASVLCCFGRCLHSEKRSIRPNREEKKKSSHSLLVFYLCVLLLVSLAKVFSKPNSAILQKHRLYLTFCNMQYSYIMDVGYRERLWFQHMNNDRGMVRVRPGDERTQSKALLTWIQEQNWQSITVQFVQIPGQHTLTVTWTLRLCYDTMNTNIKN